MTNVYDHFTRQAADERPETPDDLPGIDSRGLPLPELPVPAWRRALNVFQKAIPQKAPGRPGSALLENDQGSRNGSKGARDNTRKTAFFSPATPSLHGPGPTPPIHTPHRTMPETPVNVPIHPPVPGTASLRSFPAPGSPGNTAATSSHRTTLLLIIIIAASAALVLDLPVLFTLGGAGIALAAVMLVPLPGQQRLATPGHPTTSQDLGLRESIDRNLSGIIKRQETRAAVQDEVSEILARIESAGLTGSTGVGGAAGKRLPPMPPHPADLPGSIPECLDNQFDPGFSEPGPGDVPKGRILAQYWLVQGFAIASIQEHKDFHSYYQVIEPALTTPERIVLEEAHNYLRDVVIYNAPRKKEEIVLDREMVESAIRQFSPDMLSDRIDVLYYYLKRNLQGYGKIDPLLSDEWIEDISCNGPDESVFIYHRNFGSIPTSIRYESEELSRYTMKLAQKGDRQISLATPLVDVALPGGLRAQITYSDVVSSRGSSFTIRKFRSEPLTPIDLVRLGTFPAEVMAAIWIAVENRKSMIIVGGTASGKTSTMNAISFFIPLNVKIVSLEDTREIQLPHKNWLATKTREAAGNEQKGNIDMFDLLKAALRQRPEYIIVGEVRGEEAQTLFQAMNTGHTTYSTLHAGTVDEAVNRLVNPPINVPKQMFRALDLVVILSIHYKQGRAIRHCESLNEISIGADGSIQWDVLYEWDPIEEAMFRRNEHSNVLQHVAYMRGWSREELRRRLEERTALLRQLAQEEPRFVSEVIAIINEYLKPGTG